MKLLLSQKNSLYNLINIDDFFQPNQFEFTKDNLLYFKNSDYFFLIFEDDHRYNLLHVNYVPGENNYRDVGSNLIWEQVTDYFQSWLDNLKREVLQENLWQKLIGETNLIKFSTSFDNSKFSFKEVKNIEVRLKILEEKISQLSLTETQSFELLSALNRIEKQSKELGKFDWLNYFVGTITSIIIQLNVNKENAELIWQIVKDTFKIYFIN